LKTTRPGAIAAIAVTIGVSAVVMYGVTTFLFAFSGGQYRMVTVVNSGAVAVIAAGALSGLLAWRLRSRDVALRAAALATGAAWVAAIFIEWLLSFWLGA
jgi:hypothetical protein